MRRTRTPWRSAMASAWRVTVTGQRDGVAEQVVAHQREQRQEGLLVGEDVAGVVDQGEVLAVGVEHGPEVGPGGPHQAATCSAWASRSKSRVPSVEA